MVVSSGAAYVGLANIGIASRATKSALRIEGIIFFIFIYVIARPINAEHGLDCSLVDAPTHHLFHVFGVKSAKFSVLAHWMY